jgi:enoyl-CoA hydratase/carnithine racemase
MKRMLLRGTHRSLEEVLDAEATSQTTLRETHDRKEGMAAFLEKREPEFEGR